MTNEGVRVLRRSRRAVQLAIFALFLTLVGVDVLGVRLLVHNPLLRMDGVTKDDFPSARERRARFFGRYTRTRLCLRAPVHPRKRSPPSCARLNLHENEYACLVAFRTW